MTRLYAGWERCCDGWCRPVVRRRSDGRAVWRASVVARFPALTRRIAERAMERRLA